MGKYVHAPYARPLAKSYRTKPRGTPGPALPDKTQIGKDNRRKLTTICNDQWMKKARQGINRHLHIKALRKECFPTSKKNSYGVCYPKKKKKGKGVQSAGTALTQHRIIEKSYPKKRGK